jgi:hypothetical protein
VAVVQAVTCSITVLAQQIFRQQKCRFDCHLQIAAVSMSTECCRPNQYGSPPDQAHSVTVPTAFVEEYTSEGDWKDVLHEGTALGLSQICGE